MAAATAIQGNTVKKVEGEAHALKPTVAEGEAAADKPTEKTTDNSADHSLSKASEDDDEDLVRIHLVAALAPSSHECWRESGGSRADAGCEPGCCACTTTPKACVSP